jgi:hypothetical protein
MGRLWDDGRTGPVDRRSMCPSWQVLRWNPAGRPHRHGASNLVWLGAVGYGSTMNERTPPDASIAAVPYSGSDGQYHFLYVTYHIDTFDWYGGRHSTADLNDGYVGSGNWPQLWKQFAPEVLITEPIEFFPDLKALKRAEAKWITLEFIGNNPLCRNEQEGGHGLTPASARALHARPGHTAKMAAKIKAAYARPGGKDRINAHLRRLRQDVDAQARRLAAIRTAAADPESLTRRSITAREVGARPEVKTKRSQSLRATLAAPDKRQRKSETANERWARDGEKERHGNKTVERHHRNRAERYGINPSDVDAVNAAHAAHKAELNRRRGEAFRDRHRGNDQRAANRDKQARYRARQKAAHSATDENP